MDKVIIETPVITVGDLFSKFYVVPDYQREYVWKADEQVELMLEDLFGNFDKDTKSQKTYFLGSIVVCEQSHELYEVIDGQQRITTLYILLCAIRDYLHAIKGKKDAIERQIVSITIDDNGEDIQRFRLELQYKDSMNVLRDIADGIKLPNSAYAASASVKNIQEAYNCIYDFLIEKFAANNPQDVAVLAAGEADLKLFYAYLTKNVQLIRITTGNVARALWVFETINNRGVSLNSMDLFKNLLFRETDQAAFDKLRDDWKTLIDVLDGAKEKPLRFLRYFILANYDVTNHRLAEDEIFKWFRDNDAQCHYKKDPTQLVAKLLTSAKAYAFFADSKDQSGVNNRYLQNIKVLSGLSRQHFLLLLASMHLHTSDFNELCRQLENLIFTFIITRQQTNKLEALFARVASELRQASDTNAVFAVFDKHFKTERKALLDRFSSVFQEFTDMSLQKYRVRYVLAKMTQHIDEKAGGTQFTDSLDNYLSKVEVEHILPQKPGSQMVLEFDKTTEIDKYIHSLGNLALLEKPHNASIKNIDFAEKQRVYSMSNFLLTKSLGGPVKIGTNTSIDKAVRGIPNYTKWDSATIDERLKYLAQLALVVWDMPSA